MGLYPNLDVDNISIDNTTIFDETLKQLETMGKYKNSIKGSDTKSLKALFTINRSIKSVEHDLINSPTLKSTLDNAVEWCKILKAIVDKMSGKI